MRVRFGGLVPALLECTFEFGMKPISCTLNSLKTISSVIGLVVPMAPKKRLFSCFCAFLCCSVSLLLPAARAAEPAPPALESLAKVPPASIVIGFVGGFVHDDDIRHVPVQLSHRLRQEYPAGVWIKTFENHHLRDAYRTVLQNSTPTRTDFCPTRKRRMPVSFSTDTAGERPRR